MKIGILGGAFDPIHNDHILTARAAIQAGLVDRVNVMPCYGHKFDKKMVSVEHRWAMTTIACIRNRSETGDDIFPYRKEIDIAHTGSTYDLVTNHLTRDAMDWGAEYFYIIGSDNANAIWKWHRWQDLLLRCRFIVVQRKGQPEPESTAWYMKGGHKFIQGDIGDISSTKIRDLIAKNGYEGLMGHNVVHPEVLNYIIRNKLYI